MPRMNSWIGIAGFLLVAAVTPGPNNLVVMRKASLAGLYTTLPAIAAVVAGGIALLALVMAGVGMLYMAWPALPLLITVAGCAYLAWLGLDLVARTFITHATDAPAQPSALPDSVAGLFAFQFLNPKGWIMLLTAASAATAMPTDGNAFLRLAGLFVLVSVPGLLAWSGFGSLMTRQLRRPGARRWFDRLTGGLLLASALLLFLDT